jgi:hypothetical protein
MRAPPSEPVGAEERQPSRVEFTRVAYLAQPFQEAAFTSDIAPTSKRRVRN